MLFLDHFNIESGSLHTAYVKKQERNEEEEVKFLTTLYTPPPPITLLNKCDRRFLVKIKQKISY